MAKMIEQHRYYGPNNKNNYNAEYNTLTTGSEFNYGKNSKILALGIQTVPGIKFYLNGDNNPVFVGPSGIYEIDYSDNCEIKSLKFDKTTIDLIEEPQNYLIIDIMYDNGG